MASIPKVMRAQLEQAFQNKGLEGCQGVLQSALDEWKRTQMNVAVIGLSGTGKSSLINAFLDLDSDDERTAVVSGCNETAEEIQSYKHPKNEKLVFADLPGVGTPEFPKESYLQATGVDEYDFFLLVTSSRFDENDRWLAEEVKKRNKRLFCVRTRIGDVLTDKEAKSGSRNEEQLGKEKEPSTEDKPQQTDTERSDPASPSDIKIFVIDSYESLTQYDFPALCHEFIGDFPECKQEALLLTVRAQSKPMVDRKVECLRSRTWKAAGLSGAGALVPLPGTSFVFDVGILLHEMKFYFEQVGLDRESLRRLARTTGADVGRLTAVVTDAYGVDVASLDLRSCVDHLSVLGVSAAVFQAESAAEAAVSLALPVVGQALAASMSYLTTRWMLAKILDRMHVVADEVIDVATKCRDA